MLSFPDLPEQTLPNLCSSILAPALDFSYSTAATLIKSLLLQKVLNMQNIENGFLCLRLTGYPFIAGPGSVRTGLQMFSHCSDVTV